MWKRKLLRPHLNLVQDCHADVPATPWRDPKRFLWLLAATVPGLVPLEWLLVQSTDWPGFWWTGPALIFCVAPILDYWVGEDARNPAESLLTWLENDRYYRRVTYLYLPNQYLSLIFACWLWSGGGWVTMSGWDKVGLMITVGAIAGIGINAAHELGHRREAIERRLCKVALAQSFYGHFFVEHNRGHHVAVATPGDPASSRLGESVYRFIPRSVAGGLRSAWRIESKRLKKLNRPVWSWRNDVISGWVLSLVLFGALTLWFGGVVLPCLVGQAVIGFCLLETVNYLEHYGLRRQKLASGRYERVQPSHSWNSNTIVANVFLFHLQRHSDHHANPLRRYQALRHCDEAPQLPAGYATMIVLAFLPPLWFAVMDRRVIEHYGGDISRAALDFRHANRALPQRGSAASDRHLRYVQLSRDGGSLKL